MFDIIKTNDFNCAKIHIGDGYMIKKKILILIMLLMVVCGCQKDTTKSFATKLSIYEIVEKLQSNNNSFLLYITTDNCYTCEEYNKVLEKVVEEFGIKLYVLHYDVTKKDETFTNAIDELDITIGKVEQLPMTYYFNQGTLLPENIKAGYLEETELLKWLTSLQLIR